ncbi:MAG: hypothetical protein H6631_20060 [Anaerolineaceae bacterium]|nr:hypothetical protein [Anaerolineaceae bacterium]
MTLSNAPPLMVNPDDPGGQESSDDMVYNLIRATDLTATPFTNQLQQIFGPLDPKGDNNMAKRLEALRELGPQLKHNKTLDERDLAKWIAMRTNLHPNAIKLALLELKDAVLYHAHMGTPIKLTGLGRFAPGIDRNGNIKLNILIDRTLVSNLNNLDEYTGEIINRGNIGLNDDELKELWDAGHEDNPLEFE